MSKAYQFPEDPEQSNPFAEPAEAELVASDNPYSTSAAPATSSAPVVGNYHTTMQSRGGLLLGMGLFSLIGSLGGLPLGFYCFPIGVLVIALSLPTWLMAREDLRAMNAGAMETSGRGTTKVAWVLALISTLLALAGGVLSLVVMFWTIAEM
jgi:hypothetical protein